MSSSATRPTPGWLKPLVWPAAAVRKLLHHQHQAWFSPQDPRVLAICRLLIFWHAWPGLRVLDYALYADFHSSAWFPVSFFRAWSVPLVGASQLDTLSLLLAITAGCALVGLLYPLTAPAAALLTLYLRGIPHNFGKINHSENLLVLALFVLAFARAADAWSVDVWLKRWLRRKLGRAPAQRHGGQYRWPVRFITLLVVTMYCAAGISKLRTAGWEWALSDSFRWLLLRHHFTHHPPTQLGVWIADYPALCRALAAGSMGLELAAPLALLGKWPYRVIIPGLGLLQFGIWLTLGVSFRPMLPVFYCLLPWPQAVQLLDTILQRARARLGWAANA
jgi:hypothetical protein